MSNLLAEASTHSLATLSLLALLALGGAGALGCFRPRSIHGPNRLGRDEAPGIVWIITLFGFVGWLITPLAYGIWRGPDPAEATPFLRVALGITASTLGAVAILLGCGAARSRPWRLMGLSADRILPGALIALAGSAIVIPLTLAASAWVQVIWQLAGASQTQEHELLRIMGTVGTPLVSLLIVVSAVVIAPLFEELLFRGCLQTALSHSLKSRWAGVIIAAAAFAFVHEAGWMMPPLMLMGICLGYVYERTGNLWAPILIHAAFNGVSVGVVMMRSG
jgi:membrane protease YdiL (CAAX protease family)